MRRDLDEELQSHLQMRIDEFCAQGMDRLAAKAEALHRLGNERELRAYCEGVDERRALYDRSTNWLREWSQDLQFAMRQVGRNPGFAAVVAITLALAIGCSTAAFSIVDPVLLQGSPYHAAKNLRTVFEHRADGGARLPSYPTVSDWQTELATDTSVVAGVAFVRGNAVAMRAPRDSTPAVAAYVSPQFFTIMGARPFLGRVFAADENRPGGPNVAVISYAVFIDRFGGNRDVVGSTVDVDSVPTTIIGVMPRGFAYPNWGDPGYWFPTGLWQPVSIFQRSQPRVLTLRGLHADSRTVARLQPGVDSARAAATFHVVQSRVAAEYPAEEGKWTSVDLQSFDESMFGTLPRAMLLVSGAIALVLLLGCANVANLFLVRATVRERELAVRTALGAQRGRLVRQLLAETLVIVAAAGALSVFIAAALVGFARHALGALLPYADNLGVDARVLLFTGGLAIVVTLLVGLGPALYASRRELMSSIRTGGVSGAGHRRDRRLRNLLVSLQFAVAVTLLVASGVLIQSFRRQLNVPLGYDPRGVVSFDITPSSKAYGTPQAAADLYTRILSALDAMPGVEASSPTSAIFQTKVYRADLPQEGQTPAEGLYHIAGPEYLRTFHISLVAGRWFNEQDVRAPTGLAVSEKLARRLWGTKSGLGQRITIFRQSQDRADFGQPITLPVIGIVQDVREFDARQPPVAEVYLPYTLEVWPWIGFDVRSRTPAQTMRAIDATLRAVDSGIQFRGRPSIAATGLASIDAQSRFVAEVLIGFSLGALLLSALGLYGIVAFAVSTRTREIGIRIALGATRRGVERLVMREGLTFVVVGAIAGLVLAVGTTRLLGAMLFDTKPTDLTTFIAVPLLLLVIAALASYAPARRAARTDPTVSMKAE